MARRLFYVESIRGRRAVLTGDTAQHLRRVLRAEPGQRYEISDRECLWLAEVAGFSKDLVEFELLEELAPREAPVRAHLLAALFKFDHFEWALEKAVELGVERITPVVSARCEKGLEAAVPKRMERWRRILDEAGQQARRVRPPELFEAVPFAEALGTDAQVHLFLDENPGPAPLLAVLPAVRTAGETVCVLAGPEGGWDPSEREAAARAGWRGASLGPLVLRAETAAMAALAVVNAAWLQMPGEGEEQ
jgi:16S rRNA (uracil1498-N3)-methyltransferase